jgi:hypothetical protein
MLLTRFCLSFLVLFYSLQCLPVAKALEERSAIQRLNVQRLQRPTQLFLPTCFFRDKINTVTLKSSSEGQVLISFRFIPFGEAPQKTEEVLQFMGNGPSVQTIQIPLPETEIYRALPTESDRFKKNKNPNPPTALYQYRAVEIQAVRLNAAGEILETLQQVDTAGLPLLQKSIPLLEPHIPSQTTVIPAIQGVDANAMRSVQSMIDLAGDEEKRKRLLYDGTINRDRRIDRNTFTDNPIKTSPSGY